MELIIKDFDGLQKAYIEQKQALHEAIEVIKEVDEKEGQAYLYPSLMDDISQFLNKHEEMVKALVTKKCYDNGINVTNEKTPLKRLLRGNCG